MLEEYIHYFESETEFNNHLNSSAYTEPFLSTHPVGTGASASTKVTYNLKDLGRPLTFEIVSGGTLYWYASHTDNPKTIEYSKNGGEWTSITSSQDNGGSGTTISTVVAGDKIKFRGINTTYATNNRWTIFNCTEDCLFYAYGNVMSLINYNNFRTNNYIKNGSFRGLFYLNTGILSHDKKILCLPATSNLNYYTYQDMFNGCTRLRRAPDLPATSIAGTCYYGMFKNCASLEEMPKMAVTDTGSDSLRMMFYGCTSLKKGYINGGYLGNACCMQMFYGCTSLEEFTFPTTQNSFGPSGQSLREMFYGCTNLKKITPYKINGNLSNHCVNMFRDCTSLVDASGIEILSDALSGRFCEEMFRGCTSLKYPPKIMTTAWNYNCFHNMFYGCTSLEVAPECTCSSAGDSGAYGMFYGCTSLRDASTVHLLADTLNADCYRSMFQGCTSLVNPPQISATTMAASRCMMGMFYGCSNLEVAPDLYIDSVSYNGFNEMFRGCTKLRYIKCLATALNGYTTNWVNGVQTTAGTFVKHPDMNDWSRGNAGIPNNWTIEDAVI